MVGDLSEAVLGELARNAVSNAISDKHCQIPLRIEVKGVTLQDGFLEVLQGLYDDVVETVRLVPRIDIKSEHQCMTYGNGLTSRPAQ